MIYRVRFFGITIASLEIEPDYIVEEPDEPPTGITGGGAMNFERDTNPADPNDRYQWDEDRFGFQ